MRTSTRATFRVTPLNARTSAAGFTLIELTLVLLIVGVLVSLAAPRLARLGEARVDASARRLATTIEYLYDEAALRGRIYRLTLDLDGARYTIRTRLPYSATAGTLEQRWDPYAKDTDLDEGVRLVEVATATAKRERGVAAIDFVPEGNLEDIVITLVGEDLSERTLALDGVTGRVARHREAPET